jgi:2-polyprenyl-6-methoxyphenol hydroxylase-like FAD-dependent oxidoreductase
MEDAIALWKALRDAGSLPEALALYQERRLPPMKKILDAANASIRWYERMDELMACRRRFRLQLHDPHRPGRP